MNSPPPKPEVNITNFFAEPTVLLVPFTSLANGTIATTGLFGLSVGKISSIGKPRVSPLLSLNTMKVWNQPKLRRVKISCYIYNACAVTSRNGTQKRYKNKNKKILYSSRLYEYFPVTRGLEDIIQVKHNIIHYSDVRSRHDSTDFALTLFFHFQWWHLFAPFLKCCLRREKNFFFLPANIHGVLIISGPTYHIYFPDFPLFPILIQYFHFIDTTPLFCNLCTSSLLFMVCFWHILHRSLVQFIRTTARQNCKGYRSTF